MRVSPFREGAMFRFRSTPRLAIGPLHSEFRGRANLETGMRTLRTPQAFSEPTAREGGKGRREQKW